MIVGPNGAGKSTCYRKYLRDALKGHIDNHVDPDEIERQIRQDLDGEKLPDDEFSAMARDEAAMQRNIHLANRVSFSFETVFSDPYGDKLDFMRQAKSRGYTVALIAVGLDSPEKSAQRVATRVSKGGHNVPLDRIRDRYPRVMSNIVAGAQAASAAVIVDNSWDTSGNDDTAYDPFAVFVNGICVQTSDQIPEWWARYSKDNYLAEPFSQTLSDLVRRLLDNDHTPESLPALPAPRNPKKLH